jgi:F-type H+-transporting ATPase subunit epsilon
MKLRIVTPDEVVLDSGARKVTAEAEHGSFCLLPRHADVVAALVPGLLAYETEQGDERFLAVDGGVLVKCDDEVLVATDDALPGRDLGRLRRAVEQEFSRRRQREQVVRSAAARIEAGLARRMMELERREA